MTTFLVKETNQDAAVRAVMSRVARFGATLEKVEFASPAREGDVIFVGVKMTKENEAAAYTTLYEWFNEDQDDAPFPLGSLLYCSELD